MEEAQESWYEGIMPSLRADLMGDHPRTLVATTPKPIDILREWVQRVDGSVTLIRGSTFDNAANLSSFTLDELDRRYAGTLIGRQELYGELLDARDGMLFAYRDIDNHRCESVDDVEFTHITVGVDPTLTEEGDLMGVVVVGRDAKNHMYVLADESVPLTSREAARHIWRVFWRNGADTVVIEDNLAKRWMTDVLRDSLRGATRPGQPVPAWHLRTDQDHRLPHRQEAARRAGGAEVRAGHRPPPRDVLQLGERDAELRPDR